MERKRLTAVKTKIIPLVNGKFVKQEGFNPNYVLTPNGMRLSRIKIMATIVDKFLSESGRFASITLDDGSSTIRAKAFNAVNIFDNFSTGDIIDFIGRVKEYQGEIYLVPEIIRKVEDPNYEILRELDIKAQEKEWAGKKRIILENQKQTSDLEELKKIMEERFGIESEDIESILESQTLSQDSVEEETDETKEKILKLIVQCDKGSGCDYSELIEKGGLAEDVLDNVVNDLLTEGLCFEPRPGKIKKL